MKQVLSLALTALLASVLPLVHVSPASAAPDDVVLLADVSVASEHAVSFAGRDWFPGYTDVGGGELWVSDGTPGGTHQLLDLAPGQASSDPGYLAVFRGRLWFSARTDATGQELWSTDGTAAGTRLETDALPGAGSSGPSELTVAGERLYFSAADPAHGRELWSSDGTAVGTRLVNEIIPGPGSSVPTGFTVMGDRIVYRAFTAAAATKPFVSGPGIPAGIRQLDPLAADVNLNVGEFAVLGDKVIFKAGDVASGGEIWVSGGQPGDARGIKDIWPGEQTSSPDYLTTLGDRVFFAATSPLSGRELWSTDGTAAGTVQVRDIQPDGASGSPQDLTVLGDRLLFSANDSLHGRELWTSGGTTETTRLAVDGYPGPANGVPFGLHTGTPVGGQLLYSGADSQGAEPWATDGVTAHRLADLSPGVVSSRPVHAGVAGNVVLFAANDGKAPKLYGWTAVGSRTTVTAQPKYTAQQARKKRIALPVTVRSTTGTPLAGGRVTLTLKGRTIGSAALVDGTARVRITVRLKPGKTHRLVATWSGVPALATGSTSAAVKVRIKKTRR